MIKKTLLTLILLVTATLTAQDYAPSLYGFELGQYREATRNELGMPREQKVHDDGFEYEIFIIAPENTSYMVFEYAKGNVDVIWSIQLAGRDTSLDTGFRGLKLGDDKSAVEKALGKPDEKTDIAEYGERWEYAHSNYSVEINTGGKLSSIKIMDKLTANDPDLDKLPKFKDVAKTLTKGSNAEIGAMLSPDMEVYVGEETLYLKRSMRSEIAGDHSKIFATIRESANGLESTKPENVDENIRLTQGEDPMHVIKIQGGAISEIVFKYRNGKYVIWEINTNPI